MNKYRIFLSSPGDVGREREAAAQVIKRLNNRWHGQLELDLYIWEHEPMLATRGDFQENIPQTSEFDLVICVLWSRLGTRLHPGRHRRADGSPYRSGTEYEFETALESFRISRRPELLVYRRDEIPRFPAIPKERRAQLEQQWEALEEFSRKWFECEYTGTAQLAFNSYQNLSQFEENLERHLQELLAAYQERTGTAATTFPGRPIGQWTGPSPYRGLQVFEAEHEPIFFGRTKQRDEILGALQSRWVDEKRPFVLIFGPSGSGKSSVLRAGVMPWLCRPGVIDGIGLWRSLLFRPTDYPGDLIEGLAAALLTPSALPEIGDDGTDALALGELLRRHPEGIALLVKEALSRAAGEERKKRDLLEQPAARLAIGLDQLEEIFTSAERYSDEGRSLFFQAIKAVVETGYGWVVATLRSDFFSRCEEIAELVELKQGKGQYHLLPPNAAQLGQIIRYPAEGAGVLFEEHPEKGRLDERIRDDSLRQPGGLPLTEYALDELFRARDSSEILLHTQYEALGGVEGALRSRADETFVALPAWQQEALGPVLRQIARLGSGDDEVLTRRVASYEAATAHPGAQGLVEAFIAARLLTADQDNSGARTLMVAHEALFRVWPEIMRWEKENRDFLRVRSRLGTAMARWLECDEAKDYLLTPGRPLAEAEELLKNSTDSLDADEQRYILASLAKAAGAARRQRSVVIAVVALLTAIAGLAIWQRQEAIGQKRSALRSENKALSARKSAEDILDYLTDEFSERLRLIGHLDIIQDLQNRVETYYQNLGFSQQDPEALHKWAIILRTEADLLAEQGNLESAKTKQVRCLEIMQKLVNQDPKNTDLEHDLSVSFDNLGTVVGAQGDGDGAIKNYTSSLQILKRLSEPNPNNTEWQHDLSVAYDHLGQALKEHGDLNQAKIQLSSSCELMQKLTKQAPDNNEWEFVLSHNLLELGTVLTAQGDFWAAQTRLTAALQIDTKLTQLDPSDTQCQLLLSIIYDRLGDLLMTETTSGRGEAKSAYHQALELQQKLSTQDPNNSIWQKWLATSYQDLGKVSMAEGDLANAKQNFKSSLEVLTKLMQAHGEQALWKKEFKEVKTELTELER